MKLSEFKKLLQNSIKEVIKEELYYFKKELLLEINTKENKTIIKENKEEKPFKFNLSNIEKIVKGQTLNTEDITENQNIIHTNDPEAELPQIEVPEDMINKILKNGV